ncbi:MAG: serine/threonine protein kinase [Anaerolineae bacterium]|nr:serine/threonine protein kinase [Anaerolineae bacterium]
MPSLEGRTLGRYQILEPLGRGGMAHVFRAYHAQLDRHVAVKVLHPELVDDEPFLARFRREARAIAALRHPNIVQVHDFDVQDGVYYMVMELLEGDTLKARLADFAQRGERMPIGESVRILIDLLAALAYAHGEGVVHRDIKPANILLTRRGEAVLGDFGIAQIVGATRHTASGALIGTLSYIAPELALEGHCDARSDLYSLGIVLYEMLAARKPFAADTPLGALIEHLRAPLPSARLRCPDVPVELDAVVAQALARDPDVRYQSAEEMADALRRAAQEAGIDVPARVSLPALTTAQGRSLPAKVLSGEQRNRLVDPRLVEADTELAEGGAHQDADGDSAGGSRGRLGRAIARAAALVVVGNLAAATLAALTDRWAVFATGWPVELLLLGLGLCIVMGAASSIWLLIPVGVLLTNGLLLSYTSLTDRWTQWRVLWPLDLWVVVCVVGVTMWLSRRSDSGRRLSRWLGRALAWTAGTWSVLVIVAATVA